MGRALAERAWRWLPSAGPAGPVKLDLSQDYAEVDAPPHVRAAAKEALDRGETHYTDRPGVPALRQAVAERLLTEQGVDVGGKNGVVITCGGREALFIAVQNLVQPGDRVLVAPLRPAGVDEAIRLAGGESVPAPCSPADPAFAAALDGVSVVLLAAPDNPTGAALDAAAVAHLVAALRGRPTRLILDQSLAEPPREGHGQPHPAADPDVAARTVTVGSLSYAYGLGPWRVGYLAGPEAVIKPLREFKQAMTICTTAVSQFAALAALTGSQDWVTRLADERTARRAATTAALARAGARVTPGVGPYVWADVTPTGLDGAQFAAVLAAQGVRVTPGDAFGPLGEGFVRVTLAAPASDLHRGWEAL